MTWLRHRRSTRRPAPGPIAERADILVDEARKAQEAQAAASRSVDSVHAEAVRLRDSHAVARELRRLIEENSWTERIALSMMMREKDDD